VKGSPNAQLSIFYNNIQISSIPIQVFAVVPFSIKLVLQQVILFAVEKWNSVSKCLEKSYQYSKYTVTASLSDDVDVISSDVTSISSIKISDSTIFTLLPGNYVQGLREGNGILDLSLIASTSAIVITVLDVLAKPISLIGIATASVAISLSSVPTSPASEVLGNVITKSIITTENPEADLSVLVLYSDRQLSLLPVMTKIMLVANTTDSNVITVYKTIDGNYKIRGLINGYGAVDFFWLDICTNAVIASGSVTVEVSLTNPVFAVGLILATYAEEPELHSALSAIVAKDPTPFERLVFLSIFGLSYTLKSNGAIVSLNASQAQTYFSVDFYKNPFLYTNVLSSLMFDREQVDSVTVYIAASYAANSLSRLTGYEGTQASLTTGVIDLQKNYAYATLSDPKNIYNVSANVSFAAVVDGSEFTEIEISVRGLAPGKHGIHVHVNGNIDLPFGCANAGLHYNPFNLQHGGPFSSERHVGDLGNLLITDGIGVTRIRITDPQIKIAGAFSVIGRAVVIHLLEDDLGLGNYSDSSTTGHAGQRVACGIIKTSPMDTSSNFGKVSSPVPLTSLGFTIQPVVVAWLDKNDNVPIISQRFNRLRALPDAKLDAVLANASHTDADIGANGAIVYSIEQSGKQLAVDKFGAIRMAIDVSAPSFYETDYSATLIAKDSGTIVSNIVKHAIKFEVYDPQYLAYIEFSGAAAEFSQCDWNALLNKITNDTAVYALQPISFNSGQSLRIVYFELATTYQNMSCDKMLIETANVPLYTVYKKTASTLLNKKLTSDKALVQKLTRHIIEQSGTYTDFINSQRPPDSANSINADAAYWIGIPLGVILLLLIIILIAYRRRTQREEQLRAILESRKNLGIDEQGFRVANPDIKKLSKKQTEDTMGDTAYMFLTLQEVEANKLYGVPPSKIIKSQKYWNNKYEQPEDTEIYKHLPDSCLAAINAEADMKANPIYNKGAENNLYLIQYNTGFENPYYGSKTKQDKWDGFGFDANSPGNAHAGARYADSSALMGRRQRHPKMQKGPRCDGMENFVVHAYSQYLNSTKVVQL